MWYVTQLDIYGKKNSGAGWAGSRVLERALDGWGAGRSQS